jgi:hypothetical protein
LASFISTASAAESFRSRCGSVRGAPVCSSHTSPTAAPHVVQGTDSICLGVSSLAFTTIGILHSAAGIMFNNAQFQHISPSGKALLGLEAFS